MDVNPESHLVEYSELSRLGYICALCQRILSSDTETDDLETISSICGDCKFLLLEDLEAASPDVYPRRMPPSRRPYGSSESIETMFSQQFSQMISLARQSQPMAFDHDNQSVDGDGAAMVLQRASSRTTPSGSRRWRRVFSDSESDAFDDLYGLGESDSNVSFRRYRAASHGEADTVSYSAYGGDSDASVDDHSFLENENFGHPIEESDLESGTDIDPMNAGLYRWDSEEDDSEWEEADIEGESLRAGTQLHDSSRSNAYINWRRQFLSHDIAVTFSRRLHERVQSHNSDLLTNFEESETYNYVGESGDYLHARGLEDLLEHLAETESSRRGAPPASASFTSNMRCMTINEDKLESMACAICKETFTVGIVVNELPCSHLYHPCCILPWLSARNTCPLCRYELPTDDKDYEARKRNGHDGHETLDIHQYGTNDDSILDDAVEDEPCQTEEVVNAESGRGNRWFSLAAIAAAPVVGMVGISLMLLLGNSSAAYRRSHIPCRKENGHSRWWSFF